MKKLIVIAAAALVSASAFAGTAYLKYERTTGMTKQCVYEYLGNEYTKTIRSTELCPLSIQVN
jgi:predicted ABC-type sugar transport system permease subunit